MNQKTKILLTLSVAVAFQTFGTFAMSKTMSSHPIPSIKMARDCANPKKDAYYTDACIAFRNPKDHDFYGAPSLERPVCAINDPDSALLNIPMCGKGCKIESEDKSLPQAMCDGVMKARFERPSFVCVGAIKIGPKAYFGISVKVTDNRLPSLVQMLAEETAVRGACDGELEDL